MDVQPLDETFEHHCRVGQVLEPPLGNALDPLEGSPRLLADEPRQIQDVPPSDLVLMEDLQRVIGDPHVKKGEIAPCAANRVEGVGAEGLADIGAHDPLHRRPHAGRVEAIWLLDRKRPKGEGDAGAWRLPAEADQLEARPAQIAHQPARRGRAREHPQGGAPRLLLAAEHPQLDTGLGLHALAELATVGRFAGRCGGRGEHQGRAAGLDQGAEPPQGGERGGHAIGRERSCAGDIAPEARQNLLVEDTPDRSTVQAIHNQTYRVAADVDDGGIARAGPTFDRRHDRTRAVGPSPCVPDPTKRD